MGVSCSSPTGTIGKAVELFLFDYVEGDVADHDEEVEEARWMALDEGARALTYSGEREMVELAIDYLRKDR